MATEVNGIPIRKRGGKFRQDRFEPARTQSKTAVVLERARLSYEVSDLKETIETHLIPRKSLTAQLGLRMFPQSVEHEVIDQPTYQLDKVTGERVKTTNPVKKVVWKSDRTLLVAGTFREHDEFKRRTSRSKQIKYEREEPATIEIPVENDLFPLK